MDKNKTSIERMLLYVLNDDQRGAKTLLEDALMECRLIKQRCTTHGGGELMKNVDKLAASLQQVTSDSKFKILKGKSTQLLEEFDQYFKVFFSVLISCFI